MVWSTLNVTWTTITLIGFLASSRVLYNSVRDYYIVKIESIVKNSEHQIRLLVAEMAVASQFAITFVQLFFFTLGVLAITTPPQSRIINNVIIGTFIALAVVLMVVSLVENVIRNIVLKTGENNNAH